MGEGECVAKHADTSCSRFEDDRSIVLNCVLQRHTKCFCDSYLQANFDPRLLVRIANAASPEKKETTPKPKPKPKGQREFNGKNGSGAEGFVAFGPQLSILESSEAPKRGKARGGRGKRKRSDSGPTQPPKKKRGKLKSNGGGRNAAGSHGGHLHVIEKLVAVRNRRGREEFLIKWKGWDDARLRAAGCVVTSLSDLLALTSC